MHLEINNFRLASFCDSVTVSWMCYKMDLGGLWVLSPAPEPRLRKFNYVTKGRLMASAEREPIWGSGGFGPQWGPGAKPLVRVAKPPWSWRDFIKWEATFALKLLTISFKNINDQTNCKIALHTVITGTHPLIVGSMHTLTASPQHIGLHLCTN
jgi:hypothetical protein